MAAPHARDPEEAATVDVDIPRFNHLMVALLTGVAFATRQEWLVVLTFALLLVAVLLPGGAPLTRLYTEVVRPRVKPSGPTEFEPAAAPRFAERAGAAVLAASIFSFMVGAESLGWGSTVGVAAVAALGAVTQICIGCMIYERLVGS